MSRPPWVDRVHGGLEHCAHGVPYREACRQCWDPDEAGSRPALVVEGNHPNDIAIRGKLCEFELRRGEDGVTRLSIECGEGGARTTLRCRLLADGSLVRVLLDAHSHPVRSFRV